jgi:signal transduction histidine kinase
VSLNKHVFLGLAVVCYTYAFAATFDSIHDSILIMSVALIGLCGGLYGIRVGLLALIAILLLNTVILYIVSGKPYDILLTYNPTGIILSIVLVMIAGSMHESQQKLNDLRVSLASRVNDSTSELDKLTLRLVNNDEMERIRIGQDLHDGVGQYLTGMLLHSEALAAQLAAHHRPEKELAVKMRELIQNDLLLIRKFARSFLPNHLIQSGFVAAMNEMIDYFNETTQVVFCLKQRGVDTDLPYFSALHLYRIVQEAIFCLLQNGKSSQIDISLSIEGSKHMITIDGHECLSDLPCHDIFSSKILKYRARIINGTLAFKTLSSGNHRFRCTTELKGAVE